MEKKNTYIFHSPSLNSKAYIGGPGSFLNTPKKSITLKENNFIVFVVKDYENGPFF